MNKIKEFLNPKWNELTFVHILLLIIVFFWWIIRTIWVSRWDISPKESVSDIKTIIKYLDADIIKAIQEKETETETN